MALNDGWGRRLRSAKKKWEDLHDRDLTFGEIGARVAAMVGRPTPYSHVAAGAWFEGQEPGSFNVAIALALLLEADPGDMIVGDGLTQPVVAAAVDHEEDGSAFLARMAAKEKAPKIGGRKKPRDR